MDNQSQTQISAKTAQEQQTMQKDIRRGDKDSKLEVKEVNK